MPINVKQHATPRAHLQRPKLPVEHANAHIKQMDLSKPLPVKFQEIVRDGQGTVVGRIKIPTPTGHAFILRRLDTGAISLTTMFRAAFPTASEEAERNEANWVKASFDVTGANKSGKARFAGTWVNPEVALEIAESYALSEIIPNLVSATPDPNVVYRRSSRTQAGMQTPTASPATRPPMSSPIDVGPTPAKRRREASPVPSALATHGSVAGSDVGSPPPSPAPRRSARLKSPVPTPNITIVQKTSTKVTRTTQPGALTSGGSDDTAVDEEATEVAKVAEPNMQEDVREQQELIARLKAERAQKEAKEAAEKEVAAAKEAAEQQTEEQEMPVTVDEETFAPEEVPETRSQKRQREEEPAEYQFNFKETKEAPVEERAIATNRKVGRLQQIPPERKSLAWGALAFAAGLGAMSLLPNLQGYLF
ncbi:hypothetical protein CERSUDRAFT_117564 [Gelatoporia subvermispora B]|uniref:HTH APSES-type domain-containing protein n=1 Tax=Ceriporiopsis subvermispora (strain B) TaxID=914234 RepID=M2R577_CERS8|nr:hypothetical protein CERSUDRAFT_117564 [Gelatoporia subvermispora B]